MIRQKKFFGLAAFAVALGLIVFSGGVPPFSSLPMSANALFFIFMSSIVCVVANVAGLAPICFTALGVTVFFKILPFKSAMSGFSNPTPWLVFFSFCFGKAFVQSGASSFFANMLLRRAGGSLPLLMRLLLLIEVVLAPFIPSNAARASSSVVPILKSLQEILKAQDFKQTSLIMRYAVMVAFCTNMISSSLYLTGTAPNLLCASLAKELLHYEVTWLQWFGYMLIPCSIGLLLLPFVARLVVGIRLESLPFITVETKRRERPTKHLFTLVAVFLVVLLLWIFGSYIGVTATQAAFLGVIAMLLTGVLSWKDIQENTPAWENFFWYAGFISIAGGLNEYHVFAEIGALLGSALKAMGGYSCYAIGAVVYAYLHYCFAGISPHVVSLLPVMLILLSGAGVPLYVATMTLSSLSVLSGMLTHFGSTACPVFFGLKVVPVSVWWRIGFVMTTIMLLGVVCQGIVVWVWG